MQVVTAVVITVETAQQVFRGGGVFALADQFELIAAIADHDRQALFDQAQVLVELPAQIGEALSLKGLENKTMGFYGCVQGCIQPPLGNEGEIKDNARGPGAKGLK